ncbi:maleate cis-trans isomerase family protein [Nocardia sp. NPDC004711]
MTDSQGYRAKVGFLVPSTNTSAQPEIDDLRPVGVTNPLSRMVIRNSTMVERPGFDQVLDDIRASATPAIESLCTADPDIVVVGGSPEAFWAGSDNQDKIVAAFRDDAGGRPVITSADTISAALSQLGRLTRFAVITPYLKLGGTTVRRFFDDWEYDDVVAIEGLGAATPASIAHIDHRSLRAAVETVDSLDIEAIVQVGTNIAMARFAAAAELFLDKPVLSNNAVLYWHALRSLGSAIGSPAMVGSSNTCEQYRDFQEQDIMTTSGSVVSDLCGRFLARLTTHPAAAVSAYSDGTSSPTSRRTSPNDHRLTRRRIRPSHPGHDDADLVLDDAQLLPTADAMQSETAVRIACPAKPRSSISRRMSYMCSRFSCRTSDLHHRHPALCKKSLRSQRFWLYQVGSYLIEPAESSPASGVAIASPEDATEILFRADFSRWSASS